ncbi:hypothetical protein PI480_00872 [Lactococcus petauri]|nr:hypothetical protein [Lactococcus petauri]MDC7843088.1 hypothetical protein [Lactococcus petauri]MDC7844996.1 hypothetical protein [Lactococcus petauri]
MKFSKVAISTGVIASFMFIGTGMAHADTPKQTTHDVAIEVINGNYGTGQDRVTMLTNKGFDFEDVQTEVNNILLGKASATPTTAKKVETQPAKSKVAQTVSGLDLGQTSGQVNIEALANYMVSNTPTQQDILQANGHILLNMSLMDVQMLQMQVQVHTVRSNC